MARIKGAMMTRKRRKKVLKLAKGYYGSKSKHFKMAKQQVMKGGNYAFAGRKQKERDGHPRRKELRRAGGNSQSREIKHKSLRPCTRARALLCILSRTRLAPANLGPGACAHAGKGGAVSWCRASPAGKMRL